MHEDHSKTKIKFYMWFGGSPHACCFWVNDHLGGQKIIVLVEISTMHFKNLYRRGVPDAYYLWVGISKIRKQ